jgi:hypothetical protein
MPSSRLSEGARHVVRRDDPAGARARRADAALPRARRGSPATLAFVSTRRQEGRGQGRSGQIVAEKAAALPQSKSRSRTRCRSTISRSSSATPAAARQLPDKAPPPHRADQGAAPPARGEMGFVMPSVRILDNVQLGIANTYIDQASRRSMPAAAICARAAAWSWTRGGQPMTCRQHTTEPTFGLPATWVDERSREEAMPPRLHRGRPATVMSTHLPKC